MPKSGSFNSRSGVAPIGSESTHADRCLNLSESRQVSSHNFDALFCSSLSRRHDVGVSMHAINKWGVEVVPSGEIYGRDVRAKFRSANACWSTLVPHSIAVVARPPWNHPKRKVVQDIFSATPLPASLRLALPRKARDSAPERRCPAWWATTCTLPHDRRLRKFPFRRFDKERLHCLN